MIPCQSLPNNASGSIQAQQKTQTPAKVMGAHSGLWTCGPWCGDRNGQHQGRWITTVFCFVSLSLSFSSSVCLTLLNCRALSAVLSRSRFLAVLPNNSRTLCLSLDLSVSFCLSWFSCTVSIWNSLSLFLCLILCVALSLSICLSRIIFPFLDLFHKNVKQHTYDSIFYLPHIHWWNNQTHLNYCQET